MSSLIERVRRRQQSRSTERSKCIHEGPTKEMKKTSCCGFVRVFDCPILKHEVWHTKCISCEHYTTEQPSNALKPCVFRGIVDSGMTFCNRDGDMRVILEEECHDCADREW